MVLGLKDTNDSSCDYESRPIVTKKKRSKTVAWDIRVGHLLTGSKEARLPQSRSYITTQESLPKTKTTDVAFQDRTIGEKISEKHNDQEQFPEEKFDDEKLDEDNSVTFYDVPEQSEENSKAFMRSFGSWINDLFNAPDKRSTSLERKKCQVQKESVQEEDAEYLKSISVIKEQFRKKLKSETSVQVSSPNKPFALNFDKVSDSGNKTKKKSKSLPETNSVDWLKELNQLDEKVAEISENLSARRYSQNTTSTGLLIRTDDKIANLKPTQKKRSVLNNSILLKETKKRKNRNRRDLSELEEYIFPTPKELSKRILLNVPNEDKCMQFYKNSHLGVQEAQHYGQRKNKAYQSGARCYTTNANLIDGLESSTSKAVVNLNRSSHYCTSSAAELKDTEEILRKNSLGYKKYSARKSSKKSVSDLTRDSMSFVKVKNSKAVQPVSQEPLKADSKTSSHDLVKYLIKKIKTTRPPTIKQNKGSPNVPQVLHSPKSRFMQSATNTLVLSAIAKKDNEQLPVKNGTRVFPEPKSYPGKQLVVKQSENNIRIDVSRVPGPNKFSKLSYLLENDHVDDDALSAEQENYKNTRRPYEDALKRESKKINKHNKRDEVKEELSNLDKYDLLELPKTKQKEPKKKIEEKTEINVEEAKEAQNARFQKQHELFRTNLKQLPYDSQSQESTPAPVETKNALQELPQNNFSLSTELAVIEPELELIRNSPKTEVVDLPKLLEPKYAFVPKEHECHTPEDSTLDEKSRGFKIDRKPTEKSFPKDKVCKAKPVQFSKGSESKIVLDPLENLCPTEYQKEPSLSSSEITPVEDVLLINRRYSTNSLVEYNQKNRSSSSWNNNSPRTSLCLDDLAKGADGDKKQMFRNKKERKSPKVSRPAINQTTPEYPCGFEISKKKQAQSNWEKDE